MKIVVIGGSGLIGRRLVHNLRQDDCRVMEASPSFGVDTVTGEGLDAALRGARVVVDVSNVPSVDGEAAIRFFGTSGRNLLAAGRRAGVKHHIALSIVGADGLKASPYFRAKLLQEDLVRASTIPFTILRSTQSFEVISGVVQTGEGSDVVISPALVQPIAAKDVALTLADLATGDPLNRTIEVAGPDQFQLDELAVAMLTACEDTRRIVTDAHAAYYGARLRRRSLLPGPDAVIGALRFEDWLRHSLQSMGTSRPPRDAGTTTIGAAARTVGSPLHSRDLVGPGGISS